MNIIHVVRQICIEVNHKSDDSRREYYTHESHNSPVRLLDYPFSLYDIPGVGKILISFGSICAKYESSKRLLYKNPQKANVAGILLSQKISENEYGDKYMEVGLLDKSRDKESIEKIREFLRQKGVTTVAFQS
jgi:hypothetical protein